MKQAQLRYVKVKQSEAFAHILVYLNAHLMFLLHFIYWYRVFTHRVKLFPSGKTNSKFIKNRHQGKSQHTADFMGNGALEKVIENDNGSPFFCYCSGITLGRVIRHPNRVEKSSWINASARPNGKKCSRRRTLLISGLRVTNIHSSSTLGFAP